MTDGLPSEIAFAVVGDEEGSDGSVWIIGSEIAMPPVEAAELAVAAPRFQDGTAQRSVSQLLRQTQVLGLVDGAKFGAVLLKMLVQQGAAAETWAGGEQQERDQDAADESGGTLHLTITSLRLRHAEPVAGVVFQDALHSVEAVGGRR